MVISRPTRFTARAATAAVVALLGVLLACAAALADADPASDILLGQNVFYPYNPPVSSRLQAQLNGVVAAAHRAGFPLRVALIASPIDLGAIPSFFGKPKQYAAFLGQEINFGKRVPLLVVMPDGYGDAGLPQAATAVVTGLPRPGPGSNRLAQAASLAVPRIAAAAGHRAGHPVSEPGSSGGGPPVGLLAALAGICVLAAAGIVIWRRRAGQATAPRSR